MENERHFISLRGSVGEIRTETFRGEEHTVIPIIALVEGVMQAVNAPAPELVETSTFSRTIQAWNGRPVLVDHPRANGELVSANSPEVLESEQIGWVFASAVKRGKLTMEAWISDSQTEEAEGTQKEVLDAIRAGEVVEVSVGAFVDVKPEKGKFKGRAFEGRWTNVVPDHLAILPLEKIGACSVSDGCGANRAASGGCGPGCKCSISDEGFMQRFKEAIKSMPREVAAAVSTQLFGRFTAGELSDSDRRILLETALEKENPNDFVMVVAVFESKVVFARGNSLLQRSYEIKNDKDVSFGEGEEEVVPRTNFVTVEEEDNEEDDDKPGRKNMEKVELISVLISDPRTRFGEDDNDFLNTLDMKQLEKLIPADVEEMTVEQYLETAPEPVRDVLQEGVSIRGERRKHFIDAILKCGEGDWTEEELGKMSMQELERLGRLAHAPTFFGRPVPTSMAKVDLPKPAPKLSEQFKAKKAVNE